MFSILIYDTCIKQNVNPGKCGKRLLNALSKIGYLQPKLTGLTVCQINSLSCEYLWHEATLLLLSQVLIEVPLIHFLSNLIMLTDQWFSLKYAFENGQRDVAIKAIFFSDCTMIFDYVRIDENPIQCVVGNVRTITLGLRVAEDVIYQRKQVNTMAADYLTPCVARWSEVTYWLCRTHWLPRGRLSNPTAILVWKHYKA